MALTLSASSIQERNRTDRTHCSGPGCGAQQFLDHPDNSSKTIRQLKAGVCDLRKATNILDGKCNPNGRSAPLWPLPTLSNTMIGGCPDPNKRPPHRAACAKPGDADLYHPPEKSPRDQRLNGDLCPRKNVRDNLSMSVEMPDMVAPSEIDSALVTIRRPQDEILWSVGKVVQDFHKRNQFHDAVVKSGNGEVQAHRYVLCASSEWMRDYIMSKRETDGSAGHKQLMEIRVDSCLEAPAVCQAVDYMYTARSKLNYFNFYPVFQAAVFLRMPPLIHAAQRLMQHLMADENLAIMLEIAEQAVKSEALVRFVYRHWAEKFYNQIQLCSFLDWPYPRVYRLLVSDDIRVNTEMDVFRSAMRWITHDRSNRIQYFKDLMKAVRWVYMTQDELLLAVETEKLLIKDHEVKQLITDAQWFKTCQEHKHDWRDYTIPSSRMVSGPVCRTPRPAERTCHKEAPKLVYPRYCPPTKEEIHCPTLTGSGSGGPCSKVRPNRTSAPSNR